MGEMTPEAKAMIAEAIRIVREDKNEAWWRSKVEKGLGKKDEPTPPPPPPSNPPTDTPVDPPMDAPVDTPVGKKSAYWGEIFDD